jgi:hypothetical protein
MIKLLKKYHRKILQIHFVHEILFAGSHSINKKDNFFKSIFIIFFVEDIDVILEHCRFYLQ